MAEFDFDWAAEDDEGVSVAAAGRDEPIVAIYGDRLVVRLARIRELAARMQRDVRDRWPNPEPDRVYVLDERTRELREATLTASRLGEWTLVHVTRNTFAGVVSVAAARFRT